MIEQLQTPRLTLRPLCDADLDAMCRLLGDRTALELWGEPLDRAAVRQWIERNKARYTTAGFGRCAVVWRASGALIGDCGLSPTVVEGVAEVELGWIVARPFWARGVATEAARAWRDHAFGSVGLTRIVSMISEENVASRRVAEKLGMTAEREAIWDGQPMLLYAQESPRGRADSGPRAQGERATPIRR